MFALNLLNLSETETVTFHLSSLLSQAILELEIQDVSFAFSTFSITHHIFGKRKRPFSRSFRSFWSKASMDV